MRERGRPTVEVVLSDEERELLERWARRPKSAQALALRCRIVLACAEGVSNVEVAARLGVTDATVSKWRRRFVARGLDGLHDEPRPGAPRTVSDAQVERVIVKTLEETPADATHWSTRSMASATGMSQSTVSRLWRAFGLKPHLSESFKLSPDPQFIDKVRDIVGLYLNPPEGALVLCVDEKSQIQALDRTAPILPMRPGLPERATHDYRRHGTTNLYAALDVASGNVITGLTGRHRAVEFRGFLNQINRSVPADLDVHIVVDNSSTHKAPEIHRWLLRHPRFTLHFTPTYSSWMNLVERWFAELTTKWLRRVQSWQWRGPESNRRHHGFQPCALPAELPRRGRASLALPRWVSLRPMATRGPRPVALIGAGLDLGAGRRGVDMGPSAIRYAGLQERIEQIGVHCADWGDVETSVAEATDAGDPRAHYLDAILSSCERVARLVGRALSAGSLPLVLGGDHSIAIGTLGGMATARGAGGVLWIDAHGDLNRPESSPSGNVHGMPLAAALGVAGARVRPRQRGRVPRSSAPRSSGCAPSTRASASCSPSSTFASSR